MLKDITLGQYYREESVIHSLDPRVKIVGTLMFMLSLFIFNNFICYGICAVYLLTVILLSKVPVKFMFKGMRAVFVLLLITVAYNLFLTPGDVIFKWWIIEITREGIISAVCMMIRLTFLILGSSIMTLTTTPGRLTDGIEKLLKPLRIFKVPVHEIAMMMSIALRFIPILMEETDKIMKAQIARGADFESKNLIKKTKSLVPLLVPLFVSAFRRAEELALAMEARCYRGGDSRTKLKPLKYKGKDAAAYIIIVLELAAVIAVGLYINSLYIV
ncbi:MAG: energy-coupling factor transporter transmembrane protein EcfT [Lachnospiraceae bacterium]|nr:energy-coupling factor transporter transmembrane protein EcfT [Lachnospiraceae bacterium]